MKADLSGKVALVTGAAGGIGRAIAETFAANGAAVVIADINAAGAEAIAASLPFALAAEVDIRDEAAVNRAVDAALEKFGRLDVLVNNAGVNTLAHRVDIDSFPTAEWHRIVGIDLDGTFLMSRAAVQPMIRQGSGCVINIASTVGLAALRPAGALRCRQGRHYPPDPRHGTRARPEGHPRQRDCAWLDAHRGDTPPVLR